MLSQANQQERVFVNLLKHDLGAILSHPKIWRSWELGGPGWGGGEESSRGEDSQQRGGLPAEQRMVG